MNRTKIAYVIIGYFDEKSKRMSMVFLFFLEREDIFLRQIAEPVRSFAMLRINSAEGSLDRALLKKLDEFADYVVVGESFDRADTGGVGAAFVLRLVHGICQRHYLG